MKKYLIYIAIGLLIMILVTFVMGLGDDAYLEKYHEGVWYKDIMNSIKYYILWVIPYWWVMILIGSLLIGALTFGLKVGIGKLSG